ncbi:DUF3810 domain-containing protein [Anaerocolumna sp. MB42-C2]|uniref:DUF3810 domain-containing protein n=1 Tax=Anaerocolumna sp. MB42-C2 TaxID=3070997 RepID=UPI0027E1F5BE|nr:DUF3810 domain-containing protein [Anaerocolumna sp. MB42-C2]WMJ85440.1 DUF3810 domain-containing protein [Anaerocolumna sp. MB42-C2]
MDNNQNLELDIRKDVMEKADNMKWYRAFYKKRTLLLLLLPLSFFILWLVRNNQDIAEFVFARGIYRWISQGISLISGIFPFSLMELEVIFLPATAIYFILRFIGTIFIKLRKKEKAGYTIALGFLNGICVLSMIFFLYVMLGGTNYYRYSFASYSGLEIKDSTVDELYNLCLELADEAAGIREQLHQKKDAEDSNGVLKVSTTNWNEVSDKLEKAFMDLSKEYPVLGGYYTSLKPVFFSDFMSRMEITGIFWPFTMEANVNVDAADYSIPATMGHELAHLRGFMREDEANFIGYLVCKESDNLEFQYSGIMLALTYAGNQLYKQDPSLYQSVREHYNTKMIADLRAEYFYWEKFENTVISTVSNTVNDNYLKANKQSDGVKSYGRMVDLLLAEYRKNHPSQ